MRPVLSDDDEDTAVTEIPLRPPADVVIISHVTAELPVLRARAATRPMGSRGRGPNVVVS